MSRSNTKRKNNKKSGIAQPHIWISVSCVDDIWGEEAETLEVIY